MTRPEIEINTLVRTAQEGDRRAFSRIVEILMDPVVALTYRMTGDRETALDLAQDTFVSAWEKLAGFRGEAGFASWLYRIATNKTLNYLKSAAVQRTERLDETREATLPGGLEGGDPEEVLEDSRLRQEILEFLGTLPPQQRAVFELRFYKQMSFDEIARTIGRAVGTAKTHYRQAVTKLRTHLKEKGWHQ